jgi:hypothetical protein
MRPACRASPPLRKEQGRIDKLGLRPGTILDFAAVEGRLIGVKKEQDDRIGKWLGKGLLPGGLSVDDYLRRVRG